MRYRLLDNIRGLALINMMLYHMCWDLVYIYGVNMPWYRSNVAYIWQQCICCTFILLSGYAWSLGTHQLKRGIVVSLAGAIVSLVTIIFMPQDRVIFGVLTLLGASMLLLIPLNAAAKKISPSLGFVVSLILFVIVRNVNAGYVGFPSLNVKLPQTIYSGYVMTFLGFTDRGFYSTDYFSLFPWFFLFVSGYFLYRMTNRRAEVYFQDKWKCKPLEWVGRHSLIIYMLHQPVIYGILQLLL